MRCAAQPLLVAWRERRNVCCEKMVVKSVEIALVGLSACVQGIINVLKYISCLFKIARALLQQCWVSLLAVPNLNLRYQYVAQQQQEGEGGSTTTRLSRFYLVDISER
jgi:hypothetical protein